MAYSLDANILLHGSNQDSPYRASALAFLEQCRTREETLAVAWPTIFAYLRIATNPRIFEQPIPIGVAVDNIDELLGWPQVEIISVPAPFWPIYRTLALQIGAVGNLVPDAQLAALMQQAGVSTLYTQDRDFHRFDFLKVIDPLSA